MKDTDSIFLVNSEGELERVPHQRYQNEDLLQGIVDKYPELIVGEQINPDDPPRWIVIQREVAIPGSEEQSGRWSIDCGRIGDRRKMVVRTCEIQDCGRIGDRRKMVVRTCEIQDGELPKKQAKLVLAWAELHQDELLANWQLVMNEEEPFKIASLK